MFLVMSPSNRVLANPSLVPALLPCAIADLTAQVTSSGQITVADRYGLMTAILNDNLSDDERDAIDRLLRAT